VFEQRLFNASAVRIITKIKHFIDTNADVESRIADLELFLRKYVENETKDMVRKCEKIQKSLEEELYTLREDNKALQERLRILEKEGRTRGYSNWFLR
jgi:DNA-binding transcriptional MerR regulator